MERAIPSEVVERGIEQSRRCGEACAEAVALLVETDCVADQPELMERLSACSYASATAARALRSGSADDIANACREWAQRCEALAESIDGLSEWDQLLESCGDTCRSCISSCRAVLAALSGDPGHSR